MKSVTINLTPSSPVSIIAESSAQALADQLYAKGIRPTAIACSYEYYEAQVTRLTHHLNDMRKIVGATLGTTL